MQRHDNAERSGSNRPLIRKQANGWAEGWHRGRVEWQFNVQILKSLIQSEWTQVSDERILARIRELLVEPEIVFGNLGVR